MNPDILYEDDAVLVINKPTGVSVHRDQHTKEETIADWFVGLYPDSANVGEPLRLQDGTEIARPGIVHRLDRDTSGVMVLAKSDAAFLALKAQFQERTVEKIYRAFVHGEMKEGKGVIDRPIGKSSKDFRLRSAQRGARGLMRDAVTHWKCLKKGSGASYLELSPKTGRTHQLRVHLKAINHPIICDVLYAPKQGCALDFNRLALHAYELSFVLPEGERKTFLAPLPPEFARAESYIAS